jgi:RNA polymerase sigma factor (sigma-70 family)
MTHDHLFDDLLQRVRRGESNAAYELVRRYESAIRVAVRTHLSDPSLRRQFDSLDICQSVLASFFVRAAAGQFDLDEPGQLVALLTGMARNKLAMQVRSQHQQRRDVRRMTSMSEAWQVPSDKAPGPEQQAVHRDLLSQAYALMDPEVRQIADCRAGGTEWEEIASRMGGTAEARRKQFRRAMDEIAQTLQIE